MGPLVGGDQAEVICIRQGYELLVLETVAQPLLHLEELQDGIKGKKKDDRRDWISLKNASFEAERISFEVVSLNYGLSLVISILKVLLDILRKIISLKSLLDK